MDTITLNHFFKPKKTKVTKRNVFTYIDKDIIKDELFSKAENENWFEVAYINLHGY